MKKILKFILIISALPLVFSACRKDTAPISKYSAMLSVVNATTDGAGLLLNFGERMTQFNLAHIHSYDQYNGLFLGAYKNYGVEVSRPVTITIVTAADTMNSIFRKEMLFNSGDYYTLYLAGDASSRDTFMVKEDIPVWADSTAGVRFINLSSSAGSVSINISGNADGSEVSELKYGEMTEFKSYAVDASNPFTHFEFKDKVSGDVLGAFIFDPFSNILPISKNVTLLIRGVRDGFPPLEITRINNY